MKKALTALAIVAIAATAQAELLATWNTADNSGAVTLPVGTGVVVSDLSLFNATKTTSTTDIWGQNGTHNGGGFQFSIESITAGSFISGATIASSLTGSGTGPRQMDWYINSDAVSGQSIVRTVTTVVAFDNTLGDLYSGDVVSLRANLDAGSVRSGAADPVQSGGSVRLISTAMTLNGDIQAIPEPATMSLLGLGALAMVLRRKMKK